MTLRKTWLGAGFASLVIAAPLAAQVDIPVGNPETTTGQRERAESPPPREGAVDPQRREGAVGELPGQQGALGTQRREQGDPIDARREGAAGAQMGQEVGQFMLIGHALEMAIEGAGLHASAKMAGGDQQAGEKPQAGTGTTDPAAQLAQHARSAFEGSEKLFQQAQGGQAEGARANPAGQPGEPGQAGQGGNNFYAAANQYAESLRRICEASGEGGQQAQMSEKDKAAICLINHSVKEVVGAAKIRRASMQQGASTDPSYQAILSHAQEMDREGRQALQQFGYAAAGREPAAGQQANPSRAANREPADANQAQAQAGGEGSWSPQVQTLAQNAQDIVRSIDSERAAGAAGLPGDEPRTGLGNDRRVGDEPQPRTGTEPQPRTGTEPRTEPQPRTGAEPNAGTANPR